MLPSYSVNDKLVKDIQEDCSQSVSTAVNQQQAAAAAYYLLDWQQTPIDLCNLQGFLRPPVTCVLTPLGYSIVFNSLNVARYLLSQGASCTAAAFLVDKGGPGGKARAVELPLQALALPSREMFGLLVSYGFDPNFRLALRIRVCNSPPIEHRISGIWHLLWHCWRPMREAGTLLYTTDLLLRNGLDATAGFVAAPLGVVFKEVFRFDGKEFEDSASAGKAARLLEMLVHNGCQLDWLLHCDCVPAILLGLLRSTAQPNLLPCQESRTRFQSLVSAVFSSSPGLHRATLATASSVVTENDDEEKEVLSLKLPQLLPLKVLAMRATRQSMRGPQFARRLRQLSWVEPNIRLFLRHPAMPALRTNE